MKPETSLVFQIPTEVLWSDRVFLEKIAEFNQFLTANDVPMSILFMPVHDISPAWKVGNINSTTGRGYLFLEGDDKALPSNSMSCINLFEILTPREAFAKLVTGSGYDQKDKITAWDNDYYYQLIISSSRKGAGFEITVVCKEF